VARTISAREEWAKVGAAVRLKELDQERAEILAAFPELGGGRAARVAASPARAGRTAGRKARRKLSAEARARMSEGMRKYWARRRAKAGK
jgi:hypothetical protein